MQLPVAAERLCIYLGEADRCGHQPLYEAIVLEARRRGMAGATVLRGIMGFGAHSHLHTHKVLRLSEDLPLVIEIVDTPEHIAAFLPYLEQVLADGLVTVEPVRVALHRAGSPPA
jgi:PII-like signaling protein